MIMSNTNNNWSTIQNIGTMDYRLLSKQNKELMKDMDLVLEYMGFNDWDEMIKSIKREIKIKKILNEK
jgi:hypothetical protein